MLFDKNLSEEEVQEMCRLQTSSNEKAAYTARKKPPTHANQQVQKNSHN